MIELRDAGFAYGERVALSGISHAFDDGLITGLIGPNGSGKTTLVRLISGALRPTAGQALMAGRAAFSIPERKRARMLALVPQSARLDFDFTVLDMVLMGRQPYLGRFEREREADLALANAAIERLGLLDFAGRNARALSGGEWQRVLIARALCQDTPVLLMDEPVSSLDIRHQMEVLRAVRDLSRERRVTTILVLHDLNLAAHYCDRLLLLKDGQLQSSGVPKDVLTADSIRQTYGILAAVEQDKDGKPTVKPSYL